MKALVFGGGGAKGAYQIGAWRALNELGETFDIVTGTSIGAINAALYVQDDYELAEHLWSTLTIDDLIIAEGDILEKIINYDVRGEDIRLVVDFFKKTIDQNGLDTTPLKARLRECIDEQRVRAAKVKMGIVTVSLTDLKPLELSIDDIPEGELHDYLIASSNLPVFQNSRKNGKIMIDGGFYDNIPIELAKQMGGTEFTVIDLKSFGLGPGNKRGEKVKQKRVISSKVDIGGILEVNPQKAVQNIQLGYYDTLRSYRGYCGRDYYIESKATARDIAQKIIAADSAGILELQQLFAGTDSDQLRFVMEDLIPILHKKLDLPEAAGYLEIYVALLEEIAKSQQLEIYKIWQLEEFEAAIKARYQSGNTLNKGVSTMRRIFELINPLNGSKDIQFYNTVYEQLMR